MRFLLPTVALMVLSGCATTDTAAVSPLNAAAKQLGPVTASFVRTGTGRGPVTITMGDGEVLTGEYRVAFGSAVGTAFSGAWSSRSSAQARGGEGLRGQS
jgi:hypothetical protein